MTVLLHKDKSIILWYIFAMNTREKEIEELLTRGVSTYIDPDTTFKNKLKTSPEKVVIKFGVDPTRPDIHLGHAVILRRLRKFQDLGCKVVFLIGDYTSQIGDPTGKSKVRPEISQKEIESNMKTYLDQVGKILRTDDDVFTWIRNSDWFLNVTDIFADNPNDVVKIADNATHQEVNIPVNTFIGKAAIFDKSRMQVANLKKANAHIVSFTNVLSILRHITHSRLIERDMFQDRIKNNSELYMHEMLYPIIQGIDSALLHMVYGSCDVEVGGTDQTFNMLIGRDVMKIYKQEPQAVLSFSLLVGLDGKEKMSKSLDNYVAINDEPSDMYGKIMSLPDSAIEEYFTLCTYTPASDIEEIVSQIKNNKVNPKDIKMRLAGEIVAMYHGEGARVIAEQDFITKFQKKEIPDDVLEVVSNGDKTLMETFKQAGVVESNTEFRRLVEEGAITLLTNNNQKVTDTSVLSQEGVYKIGKKRFIKIVIN